MIIFYILFSLCFASFGGVAALRIPQRKFWDNTRSYCDYCQHPLAWYHLIPIISYLALKGKCAYCQHNINPLIFIIELIGLITGIEAYFQTTFNPYLLIILVITIAVCAITDWLYLSIWPITFIPAIISILIFQPFNRIHLIHWLSLAIILTSLFFIQKNKLGFGDIEAILLIDLLLKTKLTLEIIIIASLLIILTITIKTTSFKYQAKIAFIPFLLVAIIIRMFFYSLGLCQ